MFGVLVERICLVFYWRGYVWCSSGEDMFGVLVERICLVF